MFLNCYKAKRNDLGRRNCRGLKFTNWIKMKVERVIGKLIGGQVYINEMQFGLMPRCSQVVELQKPFLF